MSEPNAPDDFATKRIVLAVPRVEVELVDVSRLHIEGSDGGELSLDLYRSSSAAADAPHPAILFVTGYPDPGFKTLFGCVQKDLGSYVSWAQLLATIGFVAVTYRNSEPLADAITVHDHLVKQAADLNIDPQRIGVWSCSGNVPTALALLTERHRIAAAALLYGYTMDQSGFTQVAEAAARFRFPNPMAGRAVEALSATTAMLMVRAEEDAMPGLNDSLDRFIEACTGAGVSLECLPVAGQPHAFDTDSDCVESRTAIESVVEFFERRLT